jgi:hypothetical protein
MPIPNIPLVINTAGNINKYAKKNTFDYRNDRIKYLERNKKTASTINAAHKIVEKRLANARHLAETLGVNPEYINWGHDISGKSVIMNNHPDWFNNIDATIDYNEAPDYTAKAQGNVYVIPESWYDKFIKNHPNLKTAAGVIGAIGGAMMEPSGAGKLGLAERLLNSGFGYLTGRGIAAHPSTITEAAVPTGFKLSEALKGSEGVVGSIPKHSTGFNLADALKESDGAAIETTKPVKPVESTNVIDFTEPTPAVEPTIKPKVEPAVESTVEPTGQTLNLPAIIPKKTVASTNRKLSTLDKIVLTGLGLSLGGVAGGVDFLLNNPDNKTSASRIQPNNTNRVTPNNTTNRTIPSNSDKTTSSSSNKTTSSSNNTNNNSSSQQSSNNQQYYSSTQPSLTRRRFQFRNNNNNSPSEYSNTSHSPILENDPRYMEYVKNLSDKQLDQINQVRRLAKKSNLTKEQVQRLATDNIAGIIHDMVGRQYMLNRDEAPAGITLEMYQNNK